jgi:hypothetical protein
MPRKVADMRSTLLEKGFREDKTHHAMLWFFDGERKTSIRTRFSHSLKEYSDNLCAQVRKQIKLENSREFADFMDCTTKYPEYLKLMKDRGHVQDAKESQPEPKKKKK